jgi:serine/threonine-protein kinase
VKESADGRTELVMKIIEGRSLADIIEGLRARDPKLVEEYTTERRVEVFLSLLRALEFAHAEGVVHRDVKPENVMIGLHGEVLLVPHHRQSDRLKLREFCASDE